MNAYVQLDEIKGIRYRIESRGRDNLPARRAGMGSNGRNGKEPDKTIFEEFCEHLDAEMATRNVALPHGFSGSRDLEKDQERDQSEAYKREFELIKKMKHIELVARIQTLRQNLRDMMIPEDYADFMPPIVAARIELLNQVNDSIPKNPQPSDYQAAEVKRLNVLREEALALLDRAYRRYVLLPKVEEQRSATSYVMIASVLAVSLILVTLMLVYQFTGEWLWGEASVVYLTALLSGAAGATVSTLMRLNKLDMRHEPLLLWLNIRRGQGSLWLSPLIGALFGLIFLLLMRSGMVQGSLFPSFESPPWRGLHIDLGYCPSPLPSDGEDICSEKYRDFTWIIVWTFAAGWAERLVPDVLDRLSRQVPSHVREGEKPQ